MMFYGPILALHFVLISMPTVALFVTVSPDFDLGVIWQKPWATPDRETTALQICAVLLVFFVYLAIWWRPGIVGGYLTAQTGLWRDAINSEQWNYEEEIDAAA